MKYKNLKILKEKGINVPDFNLLKFKNLIMKDTELIQLFEEVNMHPVEDFSGYSTRLKDAIKNTYEGIPETTYLYRNNAVRSSSNLEDGKNTSFAGQFDTYLNVEKEEVADTVLMCLQSLYNKNVLEYAYLNGLSIEKLKMNVIIQEMVEADYSGVLFTANPQGILNESVIVVGEGLGEGIVTDQVETTSYYYNTTDDIYYYDGKEDYLSENLVQELIQIGERIKVILKNDYLDIEFSVKDNIIYILQTRPITTLDVTSPLILDNSNIVESYPGISLPLTDSFVNVVYSGVFKGVAQRVLKNKKIVARYDDVFNNMVGSANGRMYYKISNWYTLIKFLPLSHKIIPIWQDMLGVKNKSYNQKHVKLSLISKIRTYINSIYELIKVPANMDKLNEQFNDINAYFYNNFHKDITNEELTMLYGDIKDKLLRIWDVTLLNDMYAFIFTGLVKGKLKKKDPIHYEEMANDIISGVSNIESMKPIRELVELSELALQDPKSRVFRKKYKQYITVYGDRALEELKLESETFRTNKRLLNEKIKEYISDPNKLNEMKRIVTCEKQQVGTPKGILYDFYAKHAVKGIKHRESSRLNRCRIFGMVRGIFLAFGENFCKEGLMEGPRDIFYLYIDEVFDLVNNPKDVKGLINNRKIAYDQYKMLSPYSRLIFAGEVFNKKNKTINAHEYHMDTDNLHGIPCSNGKVTGEVLVIHNVKEVKNARDKILVTKMTDPGWVFLLASAKGIITEKGSLLSHTAIVSRELKIPSIVGVDHIFEVLKSGDVVTMDGNTGVIDIHRESPS